MVWGWTSLEDKPRKYFGPSQFRLSPISRAQWHRTWALIIFLSSGIGLAFAYAMLVIHSSFLQWPTSTSLNRPTNIGRHDKRTCSGRCHTVYTYIQDVSEQFQKVSDFCFPSGGLKHRQLRQWMLWPRIVPDALTKSSQCTTESPTFSERGNLCPDRKRCATCEHSPEELGLFRKFFVRESKLLRPLFVRCQIGSFSPHRNL
jgi:hypothetical protein